MTTLPGTFKLITILKELTPESHAGYNLEYWFYSFYSNQLPLVYLFHRVYGLYASVLLWLSQSLPFGPFTVNILEILYLILLLIFFLLHDMELESISPTSVICESISSHWFRVSKNSHCTRQNFNVDGNGPSEASPSPVIGDANCGFAPTAPWW